MINLLDRNSILNAFNSAQNQKLTDLSGLKFNPAVSDVSADNAFELQISAQAKYLSSAAVFQQDSEKAVAGKLEAYSLNLNVTVKIRNLALSEAAENSETDTDSKYSEEAEKLDKMLGEWSSEKVSDRIVSFASAIYEGMLIKEGGEENSEKLEKFKKMIMDAIDLGFSEANAEIGDDITDPVKEIQNKTHDLIFSKLDSFFEKRLSGEKEQTEKEVSSQYTEINISYYEEFVSATQG